MNIESRKLSFIQELLRINNEETIIRIEKLLKQWNAKQYEEEQKPMSLEQFNKEIDQAMIDSREDNVVKATDFVIK